MWVRITEDHLRRCPECLQPCLKIADPYDGEYLDDSEEAGLCYDCIEKFAAAVPAESYRELAPNVWSVVAE